MGISRNQPAEIKTRKSKGKKQQQIWKNDVTGNCVEK
jgi:hypothetical protein